MRPSRLHCAGAGLDKEQEGSCALHVNAMPMMVLHEEQEAGGDLLLAKIRPGAGEKGFSWLVSCNDPG